MAQHFKVSDFLPTLTAERREAYDALRRDPRTTIDAELEWLRAVGYDGGRSSVANHKRDFEAVLRGARKSAEVAASFGQVMREGGAETINEAALGRYQQLLMDKLMQLEAEDADTSDLMKLAISVRQSIGSTRDLKKMLAEKFDASIEALQRKYQGGQIPPEELKATRKEIFGC